MKYIKEFKDNSENKKEDFSFFFGWIDTKKNNGVLNSLIF